LEISFNSYFLIGLIIVIVGPRQQNPYLRRCV